MGALSIQQILAAEAAAIHDLTNPETKKIVDDLSELAEKAPQDLESDRADKDADERSGKDEEPQWVTNRKTFYCELNKLNRAALCLSGGGIRSATFCLGVIQALAMLARPLPASASGGSPPAQGADDTKKGSAAHRATTPQDSLLSCFHYLSTVSGGGYIGSWLSAWRHRDDLKTIWASLSGRPEGPDVEPPEISWLRAYSNYLTPKTGVASADTWVGIAIYVRNLLLNWLIIIPAVCLALLLLKFVATGSVWIARDGAWELLILVGLIGVACLIAAQAFSTSHRPTRRVRAGADSAAPNGNVNQKMFLRRDLVFSLVSAVAITSFFTSHFGVDWVVNSGKHWVLILTALAGLPIFAAGWIAGWPLRPNCRDFGFWTATGAIYGALVGLGAYLFSLLGPYGHGGMISETHALWNLLLPMIFGVPWVLMSQMAAEMIFVGLTSYEKNSDSDREWLGRAAGWVAASAIVWAIVTLLTFAGGYFVQKAVAELGSWIASVGGVSGIVTALLGKSGRTAAKKTSDKKSGSELAAEIVMAVAGPIFAAAFVLGLSIGLDALLLGDSLIDGLRTNTLGTGFILVWLAVGFAVALAIEWIASKNVNINRFSLHAVYRNRLIRAYLGASRQRRDPDLFTGFDIKDNVRVHELWPPNATQGRVNCSCLFHVVNITLNVVKTARLAWQERKAESFTVSALHSGSAYKGFRLSEEYGDYPNEGGISLGTAMAISGAAASPNMGYHSSPSITLLLAFFNVRLGWWLGNPGKEGEATYQTDGPSFAAKPLFDETFGLTTDENPWVYLSDGGHFENLGLYEMVRRRCRFILAVDAGCDPDFEFADLGNALRKIYIDLGIRVRFDGLQTLRNRPSDKAMRHECKEPGDDPRTRIPYFAIGTIDYKSADGEQCENGYVLYIKPAYHGTEGAGIRSYAAAHPAFPHESTGDQWFTESQFESYRSLGLDIMHSVVGGDEKFDYGTLHEILTGLTSTLRT